MSRNPDVRAAGSIVFRGEGPTRRVLLEHRPGYDDWTLPKGKPHHDELLPVAAVREVQEETGVRVRLTSPLPCLDYQVGSGAKRVWWWLGVQLGETDEEHDDETDLVAWPTLGEAFGMLTYPDERELLETAARTHDRPRGGALLLVRHAKAVARKNWAFDDWLRPLAPRGRAQAEAIAGLLDAFGVRRLMSSTSVRCVETLTPYATRIGVEIDTFALLSEESATGHEDRVDEKMAELASRVVDTGEPLALCGHRPVLPAMQRGLGLEPQAFSPGQCLVVHLGPSRRPEATESYPAAP